MEVKIDSQTFGKRLKLLYDNWRANRSTLWENANSLAVPVGSTSEDLRYLKSITLHLWLFGYELPDTVMVFTDKELQVVTSGKKAQLLQPLQEVCQEQAGVNLVVHTKAKGDDGSAHMAVMLDAIRAAEGDTLVGTLPKDKHEGAVATLWASQLEASGLPTVDVAAGLADLFGTKDAGEVLNVKKAAYLASKVMGFVVTKIEDIIDKEKKVKHSKLSEVTEEAITEPSKAGVKLKPENVDIAYPPIFQSGGKYDLKLSAASDDSPLHAGVILVSLGTRYSSYCANVCRTYLIDPSKQMEAEYRALLAAQEAAVGALVEGAVAGAAMDAAVRTLREKGQDRMAESLARNVGFGMGLEFRESSNVLNAKNTTPVRPGMVFNVCIGVSGLENPEATDARGKVYALQVADTVVVQPGGAAPETMTSCAKDWDKVSYTLKDEAEEEEVAGVADAFEDVTNGAAVGKKQLRYDDPNYKSAEQARKEKQEELLKTKNAETLRRLTAAANDGGGGGPSTSGRLVSSIVTYRSVGEMPPTSNLQVTVDGAAEAVLLPMYGVMVPFHITTVKGVSSSQDGDHAHIRISFNFSGAFEPAQKFPSLIFLKELSFRTSDTRHAARVVQDIKMLRSSVLQRDKERAERATLVQQEKLVRAKNRVYRLPDLWVRPGFGGKGRKLPGTLEAHQNGFRYQTPKNEVIDVMYRNISHAFFQPAEKEPITILHFHLVHPIMMGNKKTLDVQFYAEVQDVVQTLDGNRRSMYDPDEIEEEQKERERRNKMNRDFQEFVKRVQELWEREYSELQLEFDIPFRELGFEGVPHRSTVTVLPTVNCLVELTEMPFTVIPLDSIEVVNLERVGFNLKNFDAAIVFKDFSKDVMRIDAIPATRLDTIKEWLTSVKIKYYESKMNLAWKPILKSIQEDPEGFIEQGGWDFLNMEKSDSGGGESDVSSEGFNPGSEEDEESEEISSDSEDASVVDSEDGEGGSEEEEDEDEEEGLSWEELEEEAKRDDRRKDELSDGSDDERRARKRKGGGGGGGAVKRRR